MNNSNFTDYFFLIPRKIISSLENQQIPFHYYIVTFFAILILRSFIEAFTQQSINYLNYDNIKLLINLTHFYFAFLSGALSLTLLCFAATRLDIQQIMRVVLPSYMLILLGPVIDFFYSGRQGADMTYLQDISLMPSHSFLQAFLHFFGSYPGITLGMKVEMMIAIVWAFAYFYIKSRDLFTSTCYDILVYALIFFYCAAPVFIEYVLANLGFAYQYSAFLMIRFYLILIFFTGIVLAYYANKQFFLAIIRDLRWLRLSHYILMLILGLAVAIVGNENTLQKSIQDQPTVIINFIFCVMGILFAGLFSVIMNNIADQHIDEVCNQSRPLVKGDIPLITYQRIGYVSFFCALLFASVVNSKAIFLLSVIIAGYYIYSMPPIRFKRIPILSKLSIGLNSLSMIILGYILVNNQMIHFPSILFPICLIGFTMTANFIDIKDYEGDLAVGIVTLPGLMGLTYAKMLISAAYFLTYLSFTLLVSNRYAFYILLTGGLIQVTLVNKKSYQDSHVLLFHLASLMVLITLLFY